MAWSAPTHTGRQTIECMPKMALCGGLMMGVPVKDPNTPPFEIVKVPPAISSMDSVPSRAFLPYDAMELSTSAKLMPSQLLNTGTTKPLGALTATDMST